MTRACQSLPLTPDTCGKSKMYASLKIILPYLFLGLSLFSSGCGSSSDDPGSSDDPFWPLVQVSGADWAEYWPSLRELALGADAAVVGRFVDVSAGTTIQGDAPEDIVQEIVFHIEADEVLRGTLPNNRLSFGYILTQPLEQALNVELPTDQVLIFARSRDDGHADYSLVSGYGLWARTARAPIDTPTEDIPPSEGIYAEEIESFESLGDLVQYIREVLSSD